MSRGRELTLYHVSDLCVGRPECGKVCNYVFLCVCVCLCVAVGE